METFENYYIAMRRCADDGHIWPDSTSIGVTYDDCRDKAADIDRKITHYAKKNPVVAICVCNLDIETPGR